MGGVFPCINNGTIYGTANEEYSVIDSDYTNDGERISVYSINGTQAGSAISQNGQAVVGTNLQPGSVAIVKIGEKSVKVVVK